MSLVGQTRIKGCNHKRKFIFYYRPWFSRSTTPDKNVNSPITFLITLRKLCHHPNSMSVLTKKLESLVHKVNTYFILLSQVRHLLPPTSYRQLAMGHLPLEGAWMPLPFCLLLTSFLPGSCCVWPVQVYVTDLGELRGMKTHPWLYCPLMSFRSLKWADFYSRL